MPTSTKKEHITNAVRILNRLEITKQEADAFITIINETNGLNLSLSANEAVICCQTLSAQWKTLLTQIQTVTFDAAFGFEPFILEDFIKFLLTPHHFSLRLKKERRRNILYGPIHVDLRRKAINAIPDPLRMAILLRKCEQFQFINKITSILQKLYPNVIFQETDVKIENIIDIGMAHSVYLIDLSHPKIGIKQFVIKEEEHFLQQFHCQLLTQLKWPSFTTWNFVDELGRFEIAEYLGDQTAAACCQNAIGNLSDIEQRLARHAALGDSLGRGDRHLENYIMKSGQLLPIDISFLFWADNETWTQKYVAGGMYEINCLARYSEAPKLFHKKWTDFFDEYQKTILDLQAQSKMIYDHIETIFGTEDPATGSKIQFVRNRLTDAKIYSEKMKRVYQDGFAEMQHRLPAKQLLQHLAEIPHVLDNDPLLRMYFYADQGRSSTFFLLEDQPMDILRRIRELSN